MTMLAYGVFLSLLILVCHGIPVSATDRSAFDSRGKGLKMIHPFWESFNRQRVPSSSSSSSSTTTKHDWRSLMEEEFTFTDCATVKCDEVLQELSRDEVQSMLDTILSEAFGGEFLYALSGFKAEIERIVTYGVRVQKICAKCTDSESPAGNPSCYDDICGSSKYGSNATVSGLLMIPIQIDEESSQEQQSSMIVPGLLKGSILTHETQAHTCEQIPSENWSTNIISLILASNGFVSIAPDYLGYGESFDHFKGYLIRRAYKLSTIPLWRKAQQMIANESGCASELANNIVIGGYSEGGYGAVATAEGMECIGVEILSMMAGAGPYQLATAILEIFDDTRKQVYPASSLHYLVLHGSSASTIHGLYQEKYNYSKLLAEEWSVDGGVTSFSGNDIIDLTTKATSASEMRNFIPKYPDDPLIIIRSIIGDLVKINLDANITDPCRDPEGITEGVEEVCEFLLENDLRDYLRSVTYPFELCHSPMDEEVGISNVLPEFEYAHYEVSGGHTEAAPDCIFRYLTLSTDASVSNAELKSSGLCSSTEPTLSPTIDLSESPTEREQEPSSSPTIDEPDSRTDREQEPSSSPTIDEPESGADRLHFSMVWLPLVSIIYIFSMS